MLQDLVKQHLSSVIITGAVAAVSAYVLWGGDTKTWKKGRLRPSLENLGNTCFLNCVTQALSSVESFYSWIEEILLAQCKGEGNTLIVTEEVRKVAPMISALYDVFNTLNIATDGTQSTSLNKVHTAMSEHGWDTLFCQEDAYEAFQVLITSIEREARMLLPDSTSNKPIPSPVQGKFLISLECMECRTELSKKIEQFDNITLHLSKKQNISLGNLSFNSLRDMLTTYFSTEKLNDVECEHCTKQHGIPVKCDFVKHVKIAKAPKCLCIQINRTEWKNGVMEKNNQHVSFPIGCLDLTLFAYKQLLFQREDEVIEQEPAVSRPVEGYEVVRTYDVKNRNLSMVEGLHYTLKSVIVHFGTANAGHYVTYRRISDNCWLYASDDVVRMATREELERQQIYLLYYERQSVPDVLSGKCASPPLPSPLATDSECEAVPDSPPIMVGSADSPPVMVGSEDLASPTVMVTSMTFGEEEMQEAESEL